LRRFWYLEAHGIQILFLQRVIGVDSIPNNVSASDKDNTKNNRNACGNIAREHNVAGNIARKDDSKGDVADEDLVRVKIANQDDADQDSSDDSDVSEVNVGYTEEGEEWEEESLRLVLTDSAVSSVCQKKYSTEDEEMSDAASPTSAPLTDEQPQVHLASNNQMPHCRNDLIIRLQ
jgi:hypothetical protein